MYTKKDCIESLKQAKEILDKSPSKREYRELELKPSLDTIKRKFNNWNEAKKEAGLEIYNFNTEVSSKPDEIDMPREEWENLTSYQRYYHKNREEEIERSQKRKKELRSWFRKYKSQLKCEKCGEEHPACLDFHHPEEKNEGVAELVTTKSSSKEKIKQEIDKCRVLCSNCHRKHHYEENLFKDIQ